MPPLHAQVLVATGDPPLLAQFPSSLSRFGNSSSLLLIAQGNEDAEMPKGGFGREFASYDDGTSHHVYAPTPSRATEFDASLRSFRAPVVVPVHPMCMARRQRIPL